MIFDYKAYSRLLNEFIIEGEKIEQYRGPAFNKILEPICKFLRISRISSAVFDSTCDSAIIKSAPHIYYDDGNADSTRVLKFTENNVRACKANYSFMQSKSGQDWSEEEVQQIEAFEKLIYTFCDRSYASTIAKDLSMFEVEVKSNTEWRIDFVESTWFSTDIRGAQSSRTYFTVTYDENISDSERFCDIRVFTKDGKTADVIKIKQLSRYPFIVPASDKMELFTKGGEYEMEISTNVPETDIVITPTVNWVQEYRISDGKLYFNTETNSQSPRTGSIVLSYDDQYQRKVTATINLSQAYSEYANAELVSYPTVHGYAVGGITNNVYVEGTIVANGSSKNFPSNRYVIQNEAGETVVFESESLITFAQFAKVSLCLKDGMIREESEGSFTYRLISGITAAHVISSELSTFTIPEKTIAELTDNMVFSLVTLKDVEIASPVGAFTNFKTTDPGAADRTGERLALVGPSGGGKTTLCNLIPRFYEVTGGRILIDGQDIQHVTLKSLREDIGIVQQDVYLFSGSVADNIAYGKPGATREEIIEAARLAGAERFISALKDGFDTYVGERGVKLSGGQKQRIAIARVFLKNPPILILDEATSALDNESEILVGQSLEKLAHGRTTLTIAHRLTAWSAGKCSAVVHRR